MPKRVVAWQLLGWDVLDAELELLQVNKDLIVELKISDLFVCRQGGIMIRIL